MSTVHIADTGTELSRLVDEVLSGKQRDVTIAREGKLVARLVPIESRPVRLGVLAGKVVIPADIDVDNPEIAAEFGAR
jgi:antitoxin (DNA-binding transcriptional repressor) of toxin-antitoxin stability system